jgi:exonuclease III
LLHKQDPTFCCIQETYLWDKDRHYLRVKSWKTIFQANGPKKHAGVAILISNKISFQCKVIKKDKEGHFILIKSKILQEELSILNIYAPNARATTFTKDTFSKATHCTSHNNSGRIQHPTIINGQIQETETKQRHIAANRTYETNG